jgi:branched-chain amino acid transport system substrate-binding protein
MKRNIWVGIGIVVVVALAIALIAIQTKKEHNEIRIGLVTALTGPVAPYGENVRDGCLLATEEINQQGGVKGRHLKLVIEDEDNKPQDAVNAVQKLIVVEHVPVIVGPIISGGFLASAPIAEKNKVVLFSPSGMADNIREAGDYIFRNRASASQEAGALAWYIIKDLKFNNLAILRTTSDYGVSFANVCRKIIEEQGGKILIEESFEQGTTDFRSQLSKIKSDNPECLLLIGVPVELGNMLKQIKELKMDSKLFSNSIESPEIFKIAEGAEEGLTFSTTFYDPGVGDEKLKEFDRKFKYKFGRASHFFGANSYDAIYILKEVIEKNGYNGEKIKNGLYSLKEFRGVAGLTEFDEKGDLKYSKTAIKKITDKKFIFVKEIQR